MLAVYYITENKTKSPYKVCIIFCLYYYVFRTLDLKIFFTLETILALLPVGYWRLRSGYESS